MSNTDGQARTLDLAIWLTLSNWQALSLAVQDQWGGPESGAKRDWFAGAVSDLFATTALADLDAGYVEEFLLQVMQDEFEAVVDDDSAADVAELLLERRAAVLRGDGAEVERLLAAWQDRVRAGKERVDVRFVQQVDEDDDDDDEEWDPDWDGDGDVDMQDVGDAGARESTREEPLVDDDGFTKVVRRKR